MHHEFAQIYQQPRRNCNKITFVAAALTFGEIVEDEFAAFRTGLDEAGVILLEAVTGGAAALAVLFLISFISFSVTAGASTVAHMSDAPVSNEQ